MIFLNLVTLDIDWYHIFQEKGNQEATDDRIW